MFENDRKPPRIHQSIVIEILGRPPGPNESNRTTASAYRWRLRREWRKTAGDMATAHKLAWERKHAQPWETLKVATMVVTFVLPTKARNDWDNLVSTLKPLLDGIVDAGLIADDSIYALPHVYTEFEHRPGVKATRFLISEPVE
jgi:hypothetical protein